MGKPDEATLYSSPDAKINGTNGKSAKDSSGEEDSVGLKANINLFGGVMLGIGCIIGSGIFVSTKGVHENAGSVGLSLIIWVVGGLFSAIGAYCYAELGTFITKSGGDYAYVYVAFGSFMAFIRLWIECIIIRPCSLAAVSITFAAYVLQPIFPCGSPTLVPQLLAAGCLILLALVNALSVKYTTMVQNVFTMAKLMALVLIILTGFVLLAMRGEYVYENFGDMFAGTQVKPGKLALAFYSSLWAFNGWNYLNMVTEELENPRRNLPLAIAITCTVCTVIYFLTNVAFYAGVSLDDVVDSAAVAVTFSDYHYGVMSWIMPIFVALSCFGTVNGVLMTSSRLFYVASRENHMPTVLSMLNPHTNTPIPSVLFTLFLSLIFLTMSNNIYSLINYVQVVNWIAIGMATVGLIYLRYKMPPNKFPRPLQVNIAFPIVFLLGCIFLVVFPMIEEPVDTCIGLGLLASSIPVYFIFIYWKNKPQCFINAIDKMTLFCQKMMLVVGEKKD